MTKPIRHSAPRRAALCAALLAAAPLAQAVSVNPRGTGQVLLFPYYTVNGGNQTLVTVGNDSDAGKALRVTFREGRNGRRVIAFNLYLAPHDQWTSAVFNAAGEQNATAALLTDDDSCTYPAIKTSPGLPRLVDGRRYVQFVNYEYGFAYDDAGPNDLARAREGTIEVLEMASVAPGTPVAAAIAPNPATGVPGDCPSLTLAWEIPAYWKVDSRQYLRNPTGGLYGDVAIVNAATGTLMSYTATALEDFRTDPADVPRGTRNSVALHSQPGTGYLVDLANALSDPRQNIASAVVTLDGRPTELQYPAARSIDAVSAALLSATLENNYVDETQSGASTQWVVSLPTRPYYTDARLVGSTALAPFRHVYPLSGDERSGCESVRATVYDRSGRKKAQNDPTLSLCYATQIVPWRRATSPAQNLSGSALLNAPSATPGEPLFESGWASIDFAQDANGAAFQLRPANDGTVLRGLPAIGFAAFGYINGNVRDGVLANYTGAVPHRARAACKPANGNCR